jgi:hypothetical protein
MQPAANITTLMAFLAALGPVAMLLAAQRPKGALGRVRTAELHG